MEEASSLQVTSHAVVSSQAVHLRSVLKCTVASSLKCAHVRYSPALPLQLTSSGQPSLPDTG